MKKVDGRGKECLHDESSQVADTAHQTDQHRPAQITPMYLRRLMYDRTDAFRLHDRPDEECDTRYRDEDGFRSEEMPTDGVSDHREEYREA